MSNKIKEMREKLDWSRAKFCREFGIPIRTVEDWDNENTSRYPKNWVEALILEKMNMIYEKENKNEKIYNKSNK